MAVGAGRATRLLITAMLTGLLLAACSQQQLYDGTQGLRQQQCDRLMDVEKREACLREANQSFKNYDAKQHAPAAPAP